MKKMLLHLCFFMSHFNHLSLARPIEEVEGIERGNGGDSYDDQSEIAWFVDKNKPIKYCIDIADNFGMSPVQVKKDLESAFTLWKNFNIERDITFLGKFAPSFNWQPVNSCLEKHDLAFYFGTQANFVESERIHHYKPFGFAKRTEYLTFLGWGKGFIWIAPNNMWKEGEPNWYKPNSLVAMLTHEIGHTLGNSHIEGTIMSKNIFEIVTLPKYEKLRTLIEHSTVLGNDKITEYAINGKAGHDQKTVLKNLFHIETNSQIKVKFILNENLVGFLKYTYDSQTFEIPVTFANVKNKSAGFSNQKSFKVTTGVHDSQGRPIDIFSQALDIESTVQYGVATLPNQEKRQLVMYKNFNGCKLTIDVISGTNSYPIFISINPGE